MEKRNFSNVVKKAWGSEEWIVDKHYCGKFLNINQGHQTSLHYHDKKAETFYVLHGKLMVDDGNKSVVLNEGDIFDISPNQLHRATAITDVRIIEFSTQHDENDGHRVEFGGKADRDKTVSRMKAVILCGGPGTRLRPLTYEIPKGLIPVKGEPILEHLLDLLKKHNINHVFLSVGYLKEKIKEYFANGDKMGMRINYLEENEPLGTAGGMHMAKEHLKETFIVSNGDELKDIDIAEMLKVHKENNALVTLALTKVDNPQHYGVARLDGDKILEFVEKPTIENAPSNYINAGFYIMEPEVFNYIPQGFAMFEKDVFPKIAAEGRLYGHKFSGQWFDAGTFERYEQAINNWKGIN